MKTKTPNMPARNPWLTDSVYPITHINSAQTDSVLHAGPTKGRKLTAADVMTLPTVFTSNPTIKKEGGETILIGSGVNGIRKIIATGESFKEVSFLPYPGFEATAAKGTPEAIRAVLAEADAARRSNDEAKILALSKKMDELGFGYKTFGDGIYNLMDKDGFHYALFGGVNIIKTTDDNDPKKPIRLVKAKNVTEDLPPDLAKSVTRIIGIGMTYDGHIVAAAPGAIFLLDRDLNVKGTITFPGEAVDNGIAADEKGIYVVTSMRMLKLVWTGTKLSYDEADGGWQSEYNTMSEADSKAAGSLSRGSGTTPALMGFGDDPDKLVVISDADKNGANLVAFWRDGIPAGFKQKPGTKSARIADQIRIDFSKLTLEVSPQVLGYGVTVINSTYPKPAGDIWGNAMTAGLTRPAPLGMQKLTWNPETDAFVKSWANKEIDHTDLVVPVISAKTGMIYAAHKVSGDYQVVGLDFHTGEVKARWIFPDDSRVWNAFASTPTLLEDGDLLIGGFFTIKRVNVGDGK